MNKSTKNIIKDLLLVVVIVLLFATIIINKEKESQKILELELQLNQYKEKVK